MRGCYRIQRVILPYLDNAISERSRERIERHLKGCSRCQRELELLKETGDLLSQKKRPEMPEEYWQRFQDKLRYRLTPHYRFVPQVEFFRRAPVLVACSIISILLVSLVVLKMHNTVFSYQNQLLRIQAKLGQMEGENRKLLTRIAMAEKKSQTPQYQKLTPFLPRGVMYQEKPTNAGESRIVAEKNVRSPRYERVILCEDDPVSGKKKILIFDREIIEIKEGEEKVFPYLTGEYFQ